MAKKTTTKPHTRSWGKQRPHLWVTGPDPVLHKKYLVWLQQRNQALFRGEGWSIDFEVWVEIWGDNWHRRGRERGTMCMTRLDWEQPWSPENVIIVPRSAHAKAQGHARAAGWCSPAQARRRQQISTKE